MPKRQNKSGGNPPKRPARAPARADSSDEEEDAGELKALLAMVEALESEVALREAGGGDGSNTSSTPAPTRVERCGEKCRSWRETQPIAVTFF